MKKYFIYCLLMMGNLITIGQNNPIFTGGDADGFSNNNFLQPGSNIFNGGDADGWASTTYLQPVANIFNGGDADGWASTNYLQPVSNIFNGGEADGWAATNFLQPGNSIFNGGEGDGWAFTIYLQAGNNIFNGGQGDGWASTYRPLGPLPLLLTFFNAAKYKTTAALLTWETSLEINTAYFDLERSADGINFSKIAHIISAANSQQLTAYSFIDNAPMSGNNFYRLKMVDADGAFTYSIYRVLNFDAQTNGNVKFYPNPTRGKLFVDFTSEMAKENKIISVYTATGNLIKQFINTANTAAKLEIDFSRFPKGTYFIQVKTTTEQLTQRIVLE